MGRAIVREPQVFLMDEPLSNLDASLRFQMRAEIANLQQRIGVTTIYVTHDQVEAMTIGNRVAVMRHGQLLQLGDPQEVYDRPADLFVARFIGSPPMNLIEGTLADGGYAVSIGERVVPLDGGETAERGALDAYVGRPGGRAGPSGSRTLPSPATFPPSGASRNRRPPRDARLRRPRPLRGGRRSAALGTGACRGRGGRRRSGRARAAADELGLQFIGRFDPRSSTTQQERVEVAIRPGSIQLFDPETGAAIGSRSALRNVRLDHRVAEATLVSSAAAPAPPAG